ncbi:MAG: GNAT family N-acetyltransferase, partial [Ruminiclostridium sp.]|nr:GNAT family N-acetyltransferase [Ruminiclostridium sp.]
YDKYKDDETNPYMESTETILRKYTREGTQGYIFIKDGIPVGTVRVNTRPETKSGRILALGVLPQYQNQGIAQNAIRQIEEIYSNIEHWYLDTILQEAGNCHLYEKLGYKQTGKTETINEKMTLVFYEKHINN